MESFSGTFVPFDWSVKMDVGLLNIFPLPAGTKALLLEDLGRKSFPSCAQLAGPCSPSFSSTTLLQGLVARNIWKLVGSATKFITCSLWKNSSLFTAFFCSLEGWFLAIPKDTFWKIPPAGHHSKFSAFQGATIRPSPPCQYFSLGEILVFTWALLCLYLWWSG